MEGSIGKALRDERLKRKLTVEEVARATKISKERIVDLEADDYARFSGLAYARSFLLLYAKYLGVESSKFNLVEVGSPVVATDYQYLQSDAGVTSLRFGPKNEVPAPKRWRLLVMLLVFAGAIAVGVATALLVMDTKRLPSVDQLLKMREEASSHPPVADGNEAPETGEPMVTPTPAPTPTPPVDTQEAQDEGAIEAAIDILEGGATVVVRPADAPEALPADEATQAVVVGGAPEEKPAEELSRPEEEPVVPLNSATEVGGPQSGAIPADEGGAGLQPADVAALNPAHGKSREIKVRVTKRMLVRVVRDDAASTPVYNGYLTPSSSLTYRGKFFWVSAKDREALKVTIDGKEVSSAPQSNNSSESGVEIQ